MAMIQCEECGQWISDRANACPNCGCPLYDSYDIGYQQEQGAMQARYEANENAKARKRLSNKRWRTYCIVMSTIFFLVTFSIGKGVFSPDHLYSFAIFGIAFLIVLGWSGMALWKHVILHVALPHFLTFEIMLLSACVGYLSGSLVAMQSW